MEKQDYFKRVHLTTQTRFWINNVTKEEAGLAIRAGAVGCTQNPSYVWRILNGSEDQELAEKLTTSYIGQEDDDNEVLIWLQRELVKEIAKQFYPMFKNSKEKYGYVSIQGNPFREDTESIVKFARYNCLAGENIMAKIPVTEDGLKAVSILAADGIPINATECMAVRQVIDVCEVYRDAIKDLENPAPLYFSLITGIFDEYLYKTVEKENIDISPDTLWQAGISIAKKVHAIVAERNYPCGFIGGGARGLHHFTEMVGANANITINWKGTAEELIKNDPPVISRFLQPTPSSVIDELLEKLEDYRKAYFINGIEADEYEEYGPVVLFRNIFENGWENARERIKSIRNGKSE